MSGAINTNTFQTVAMPTRSATGATGDLKLAMFSDQPQQTDIFQSVHAPANPTVPRPIQSPPGPSAAPAAVSTQALAQTASDTSLSAGIAGGSGLSLILLGIPDGAKKALAEKVANLYDVPHVSVGKLISDEIGSGSALGQAMQQARNDGAVPSGEQVADLIAKRLSSDDCKKGFVLDAFMTDLAGDALHRLTSLNDNVKAVTLSSIGETKSEVPAIDSLKQRGDVYTLDDTGDTDSDASVLGAMAANFTAPKQDTTLFA